MKAKILFLGLLLGTLPLAAQQPKWKVGTSLIDFSGSPAQIVSSFPAPTNTPGTWATNAAYDGNGNVLFYVNNEKIHKPDGSIVGFATGVHEIGIVKVPDNCNRYYVIGMSMGPVGSTASLSYSMVEAFNGTVNIVPGYNNVNLGSMGVLTGSLAISKLKNNSTRYLFVVADNVRKYIISSTGISFDSTIIPNINDISEEADLYEDPVTGNMKLAFACYGQFKIYNLDAQGNYTSTYNLPASMNVSSVKGLEFIDSNRVIVATTNQNRLGIINIPNNSISFIPNSSQYRDSQIERAVDGKFYTTSDYPYKLASIDITNLSVSDVLPLPSVCNYHIRSLPDQVDNENYIKTDLAAFDSSSDTGLEPNPSATAWATIFQSSDIWNRMTNSGLNITHENPGYAGPGSNVMRFRVRNIGCETSSPGFARLYWTMGATGETWPESWTGGPNGEATTTINGQPAGAELRQAYTGFNPSNEYVSGQGFKIPALAPGQEYIIDARWHPVNPTIYGANVDTVICFLGRIINDDDPMFNENQGPYAPIVPNVMNNNNIVTRNTRLMNIGGLYPIRSSGFFVGNYLEHATTFNVRLERVQASSLPFEDIASITVKLDDRLWDRWKSAGMKGDGIEVLDYNTHEILITDPQNAILRYIHLEPTEYLPIVISFKLNHGNTASVENYNFVVSQQITDNPDEQYGTMCHFLVSVNERHSDGELFCDEGDCIQENKNQNTSVFEKEIILSPNPSSDEAALEMTLKEDTNIKVRLTDYNGKTVKSITDGTSMKKGINSLKFSTSELMNGIYIVDILVGSEKKSIQLIVKH